jgi:hypothetical protein
MRSSTSSDESKSEKNNVEGMAQKVMLDDREIRTIGCAVNNRNGMMAYWV